jgi:hypothetical protein
LPRRDRQRYDQLPLPAARGDHVTEPGGRAELWFSLEAPDLGPGQVEVTALTKFLEGIQRTVTILVEQAWGRHGGKGRRPEVIRQGAQLVLEEPRPGSFSATLLPAPRPEAMWDGEVLERALSQVGDGLQDLAEGRTPEMPDAARDALVEAARAACGGGGRLVVAKGKEGQRYVIDSGVLPAPPPAHPGTGEVVRLAGELLEIDYRDRTAELWTSDGRHFKLVLDDEGLAQVDAQRRNYVAVTGKWESRRDRRLRVESVIPLHDEAGFWQTLTLAELEERQGVGPVTDLASLVLPSWAADDDEDEFLDMLRRWREAS